MRKTVSLFVLVLAISYLTAFYQVPRAVPTAAREYAGVHLQPSDRISERAEAGGRPPNDDFVNATVITTLPFTDGPLATKNANREAGELFTCGGRGKTVWYRFTPTEETVIVVDTFGSDYRTPLSVFSGESLATLSEIACNNRAGPGPFGGAQSRWSLKARVGVTYYFRVGSLLQASGLLMFNARGGAPPANDDFGDAQVVSGLPFTDTKSTDFATVEADELRPFCTSQHGVSTIWYSFTPAEDMLIVADTNGSDFTTVLSAWTRDQSGVIEITCTSQLSFLHSRFAIEAVAGQTYYFQVGGFSFREQAGTAVFNLDLGIPPANDDFPDATVVEALPFSNFVDTVTATSEPNEPDCGSGAIAASVWYSYTPDEDSILVVDTAGTNFYPTRVGIYLEDELRNLAPVACFGARRFGFVASAGQTYFFQLGSADSAFSSPATGDLAFRLDSLPIPSCPPAQFSIPDPTGDLRSTPFDFPDIAAVSGGVGEDNFCVTVEFVDQVDPPDAGTEEAAFVWLAFDTDGNPRTGDDLATYDSCGVETDLGVDVRIDIWGTSGVLVPLYQPEVSDVVVSFAATSFTVSIPLSVLGGGPPFNFAVMAGSTYNPSFKPIIIAPSDCAPNGGFIQWPAALGDVTCNGAVDSIDAALVLQFEAALITSLPCADSADANGDGTINSLDAALILQIDAGLMA